MARTFNESALNYLSTGASTAYDFNNNVLICALIYRASTGGTHGIFGSGVNGVGGYGFWLRKLFKKSFLCFQKG